ncbi:hypothetical protein BUALT_Bualt18G0046200 [Buddleja alternifolia]|uniref:Uncharacterized protein n=1 Tax=Buddleja alternifolia TaxID=168488 RepID=A0AAV6W3V0_9LAMI|nr:hypothetical protein BUALT_Bualt18G0046200 [Buddleja alternifolia]
MGQCFEDIGMVSIGLKVLSLRKHRSRNLYEDNLTADEGESSYDRKKRTVDRKDRKKSTGYHGGVSIENQSGCLVDHLCAFLRSCREKFSHISMDRSSSHVAETALK